MITSFHNKIINTPSQHLGLPLASYFAQEVVPVMIKDVNRQQQKTAPVHHICVMMMATHKAERRIHHLEEYQKYDDDETQVLQDSW